MRWRAGASAWRGNAGSAVFLESGRPDGSNPKRVSRRPGRVFGSDPDRWKSVAASGDRCNAEATVSFGRCALVVPRSLGLGAETSGVLDFGVLDGRGTEAPGRVRAWSRVTFRLRNIPVLRSRQPDHTPNVPGARPAPGRQGCVSRDTSSIGPTPMLPGALSLRNSPNDLWTARGPERRQ